MITYKGDIKLITDIDGDIDINLQNGQPEMTEFIDTFVYLLVYGEDSWYNGIVTEEAEKMKSRFPELLRHANVSDETIADGIAYITEALQPLLSQQIASNVYVYGDIISVYGIRWAVNIERFDGSGSKYSILWDRGFTQLENINGTN